MNTDLCAGNLLAVHYNRLNGDYSGWNLWVWNEEGPKTVLNNPGRKDGYGVYFKIDLETFRLSGTKNRLSCRNTENGKKKTAPTGFWKRKKKAMSILWRGMRPFTALRLRFLQK